MLIVASLLGWLTAIALTLTLLNYPMKQVNRLWIVKLPKESSLRQTYVRFMRFLILNHRFMALAGLVSLVLHLVLQILYRWVSITGLIATALVVVGAGLGAFGHYIRKKNRSAWFHIHRITAILMIVAIIVHRVTQGI